MNRRHSLALALLAPWVVACGESSQSAPADAGSDVVTIVDAGPDVDNGAPSTNYPAPHPPLPTLVNTAHGPVLTTPNTYLIFFPTNAMEPQLKTFAQAMTTATYWKTTTQEYGVGALSYKGAVDLVEAAPKTISQADLQAWVGTKIQSGAFGTPDPQAIYTIVFPSTTSISMPNPVSSALPEPKSCTDFLGYHDNTTVAVGDAGAVTYAFAVIPTCGAVGSLTNTISHEWVEASTDPDLSSATPVSGGPKAAFYLPDSDHIAWGLLGGGEAGDLCEREGPAINITPPDVGQPVQRTWSNLAAQANHDPCVPGINGAYFDSAPVLDETVTVDSTFTGKLTTKGIAIPFGGSKTIEVDLFSDGDPGGPWTVSADDLLSTYYGSFGLQPSMTFAWDRTSGQNGEKLHLTITVTGASFIGGAHAFEITSTLGSRVAVWPGIVVEQ